MPAVRFADVFPTWLPVSEEATEAAKGVQIPDFNTHDGFRQAALWWLDAGYKVLRETPPDMTDKQGRIAYKTAGKTPRVKGNQYEQGTRDPEVIKQWWSGEDCKCNPGVITQAAGVLVVDIDPREGGDKHFRFLCDEIGIDTADVPRDGSPSSDGGFHIFWKLPENAPVIKTSRPILDGVDIPWHVPVTPGQRWVKVGTDHRNKRVMDFRPYHWVAGDPRELPLAPPALIEAIANLGGVKDVDPNPNAYTGELGKMVFAAIATEAGDLDELLRTGIPHRSQNPTVLVLATKMARFGVDMEEAIATLQTILSKSPQDPEDPWTRAHLYGVGTPDSPGWTPGIVYRQYEFIGKHKEAEHQERVRVLKNLFPNRFRTK